MPLWLVLSLVSLVAWTASRVISKFALARITTAQYFFFGAVISLPATILYVVFIEHPSLGAWRGAIGLGVVNTIAFFIALESIRRGPIGVVAPLSGLSTAVTVILAFVLLKETPQGIHLLGIGVALAATVLLTIRVETQETGEPHWLRLALVAILLLGVNQFFTKKVVVADGVATYLLVNTLMHSAIGYILVLRERKALFPRMREESKTPLDSEKPLAVLIRTHLLGVMVGAMVLASFTYIGFLAALTLGPLSIIAPLVSMGAGFAGLIGAFLLHEPLRRMQYAGLAMAIIGAILLSLPG